ncbi:MAG: hypothetical protein NTX43_13190 [Bacteroidetes bacterium]|nr:hypothetical protein [Bacteroidota bacterium]
MKPQTFSKFVFILIALLILAGQSYAGKTLKDTAATIREAIKEQVKHPGYIKVQDNLCCADILFTVTDDGKLLVKRIISDNAALSAYITEKFSEIKFTKLGSPLNQYYRIKLSFRLI